VLLNATPVTLAEAENKDDVQAISPIPEPIKGSVKNAPSVNRSTSPKNGAYEQYRQFRREYKLMEAIKKKGVAQSSSQNQRGSQKDVMKNDVQEDVKVTQSNVELEDDSDALEKANDEEESPLGQNADLKLYMPDPYSKEIVEKTAKQVKYEVNIVQLFKDGQVPEEIFTRLFNNMADEISALVTRREEVTNELKVLMKGYGSTVQSAQQGMKLLDLRKSLDDVTDEEYDIKAAALNWDIDHYGKKISEGKLKAEYLRSLGNIILPEEVNELQKIATKCMETSSMKHISESTREKIKKAMQEASSIFSEIYKS